MGAERKIVQKRCFRGKRHNNKILKVQILLSRNFVVIAQAPAAEHLFQSRSLKTWSVLICKTLINTNVGFSRRATEKSSRRLTSEKGGLLEKGSFQRSPFLDILENLEILEFLENRQTVEKKGENDHFLEILENLEILEIVEIPPMKRPLSK